jgi:hypothetical protein
MVLMSYVDEKDEKKSVPNLAIVVAIIIGFGLFGAALYLNRPEAYMPIGGVLMAALSAVGVKAYKQTS